MYITFNIILEMLKREMHDNMIVTNKQISALLESIERINKLNPDLAGDDIYGELAEVSYNVDRLTMDLRKALISFHSELRMLGYEPAALPMDNPPKLEIDVAGPDVRIELDGILPYPITGSVYYLHGKLDRTLALFREENRIPHPLFTERCAVIFIHHYRQTEKDFAEIRDYDNMERRCILNVLAQHFLKDDSPSCCITMDTIAPGDRNFTEIRLTGLSRFREYVMSDNIGYSPYVTVSKKRPSLYHKN